jgi:hypothetical protein
MNAALPKRSVVLAIGCPCFIAGTAVHTDKGLMPIEQIKVGDLVLSQPEKGGDRAYKRVVNTFAFEDKAVWVVKYSFGDVPAESEHYRIMYHLYATDNHPFWVDGKGWIAVKYLKKENLARLTTGESVRIEQVWPVVRTPTEGLGWVSSDALNSPEGIEDQGHIVDFRDGCNLWKYHRLRKDETEGVPHFGGMFSTDFDTPFHGEDLYDIYRSDDPLFKARVYNLEVEEFHTYYVGEIGVWVSSLCNSIEPA